METYIVIVTFNGLKWLRRCLESTRPYPVIIVDNNSTDGTIKYIRDKHPEVTLLEQGKNLGFGKANNIGISYALKLGAEFVLLLNQDAYLFSTTVDHSVRLHKANTDYGILSPVHINNKRDKLDANFSNYVSYLKNPYFFSDFVLKKALHDIYEVPFVNAAAWLISKKCLEEVGGFDPIFFHYGEDDNFCQRLKYHNFKIGIVPGEFVIHDREQRKNKSSQPYSLDFLINKERGYKIKYANINLDQVNFQWEKKRLRKSIFKSLVFVRLNLVRLYLKELEMIKRIEPEIMDSRNRNRSKGPHYLN